eukprot:13192266-Ditylum_brightwellii.AAC.1
MSYMMGKCCTCSHNIHCGTENITCFIYAPDIKEMVSVTVITSVHSLLQQNRSRSTQGQSVDGLTRALKT